MNDIFLTGSSGFVGRNLHSSFKNKYKIVNYNRKSKVIDTNSNIYIHLAGKAHDLKNTSNPEEYYQVNTELTQEIFNKFLESKSSIFIYLSSVKAAADSIQDILLESTIPNPLTDYGKSKLLAENYILSKKEVWGNKKIYILRPTMIYGKYNKGNLNLLFNLIKYRIPWFLSKFENKRSFCYIDNLLFIIEELINNKNIESGIYNVADSETISTNNLVNLIADSLNIKLFKFHISKNLIISFTRICDLFKLPFNSDKLDKLTSSYIVSNKKILTANNKKLPYTTKDGLVITFNSFNN
jgi:nucleoside-diphosphate-sugar epimerase